MLRGEVCDAVSTGAGPLSESEGEVHQVRISVLFESLTFYVQSRNNAYSSPAQAMPFCIIAIPEAG